MKQTTFNESQNFLSKWFLVLFLPITGFTFYKFFTLATWDYKAFFGIATLLVIVLLFALARLRTRLDKNGIFVDFKPFVWNKTWSWSEISRVEVKQYSLLDYGGWGYRFGKNGTAITTKGKHGFMIHFNNGRKILIGTQQPEAVQNQLKALADGE